MVNGWVTNTLWQHGFLQIDDASHHNRTVSGACSAFKRKGV